MLNIEVLMKRKKIIFNTLNNEIFVLEIYNFENNESVVTDVIDTNQRIKR